MVLISRGRYRVRLAQSSEDVSAALRLRALVFAPQNACDRDSFDGLFQHVLVFDECSDELVCCYRILPLLDGSAISTSYSAQFYDLSLLETYAGKIIEVGRFCLRPGCTDPDILRLAWGALTSYVEARRVELLFGCSAFAGNDPMQYSDAFALLRDSHIAPECWSPGEKTSDIYRFSTDLRGTGDSNKGLQNMPPLLKTYLQMGAWVSDHAVFDRQLNTLHVFTGLEVSAIPSTRKRLLRAIAG
ncbi:MAG: GNAT family N-acyltransferase [Paracoccaceae bacterium]